MLDAQPADTFLGLDCATKGLAFVNGFNMGWYWPQAGVPDSLPLLLHCVLVRQADSAPAQGLQQQICASYRAASAAAGPQLTLYVPAPLLKQGSNELTVLEFGSMQPGCAGASLTASAACNVELSVGVHAGQLEAQPRFGQRAALTGL